MKYLVIFISLCLNLFSQSIIEPTSRYIASSSVTDMIVDKENLYAATKAGRIDVFDLKSTKKIAKIDIPTIKDFLGKKIDSKVYSIDILKGTLVILSQASKGSRRVHFFEENKLTLVISAKEEMYISKVKFLNSETLVLGLLSNEIISYDIGKKQINWRVQVSHSKFSDFVLNEQKDEIIIADESGDLKILNFKNGDLIETLSGQNLDNVFQLDNKAGIIATAGQDRRVVVYDRKSDSSYYKLSSFLVYSVGLSPSGKLVGYASDENNNVTVFDSSTKESIGVFGLNRMTLNKILFLNENSFLVSSDDKTINFYRIK